MTPALKEKLLGQIRHLVGAAGVSIIAILVYTHRFHVDVTSLLPLLTAVAPFALSWWQKSGQAEKLDTALKLPAGTSTAVLETVMKDVDTKGIATMSKPQALDILSDAAKVAQDKLARQALP